MNMDDGEGREDAVCEGCLSQNHRTIAEITEYDVKKVFYDIINIPDADIAALSLRLCAECKDSIVKFLEFRRQVLEARDTVNKYLPEASEVKTEQPLATPSEVKSDPEDLVTPLPFVKVELDGEDHFLDDDSRGADDLKPTLEPSLKKKNKVRSRSKCEKSTEDEFNASDEEPLTKKKTDASVKKEKRKGRRERPAGVVDNSRVRRKLQQLNVDAGLVSMEILSWEQVAAERAAAASGVRYTQSVWRCQHCVLGFNHRTKLENHMKKHDPSAGAHECSVCTVRCKDAHALSAHVRRHRVRWRCTVCGCGWSRVCVAADHAARAHHAPPPTHTCTLCGHTDTSLGKLRLHMKSHAERQRCHLCGKTFRDRTSLRTHLFIHSGEKEFSCPRCDKRFMFRAALAVHLVTHDAPAHLYCHQCDFSFKNRMSYTQHMKYSLKHCDPAALKYKCIECDKRFLKESRLREHTLAVHLKETPLACDHPGCSFACASGGALRSHRRAAHGPPAPPRHICHTCGRTYKSKKSLEGHLRSHSGERPYSCAVCGATFAYDAALYNHTRLVHLKHKLGRKAPPPPAVPPDTPST
ncbi:zinc finger protein 37 isoform X3 [Spodoptera frugiperda]|uniref:Zinc finger protein 37 isoform X3 n=1 Tax=Spodoptera frugiperda TaxID=7108 RepID=A0A9R0E105_SPOFR|nr:zinc finger protein 37 isoform X3 [Spodoptera frugiperda]